MAIKTTIEKFHPARVVRAIRRRMPSVINLGQRATCTKVKFDGSVIIRKSFNNSERARYALANECWARHLFADSPWICPIIRSAENWIEMPQLPDSYRLDKIANKLSEAEKLKIAGESIWIILDMLVQGVAHRDFHCKNIFLVGGKHLVVTDFEYMVAYPPLQVPALPLCYDITGQGLAAPIGTGNMHYNADTPSKLALNFVLGLPLERAFIELNSQLRAYLVNVCSTFHKKGDRHTLRHPRIYGSFQLPYFSVQPEEAQRDSSKRLRDFSIEERHVKRKSILDLGANIGAMLFSLQQFAPRNSLGIEYDKDKVKAARRIAAYNGLQKVKFKQGDIDQIKFGEEASDIVFCLAVEAHLKDPDRLYPLLASITQERLYMEANSTTDINSVLSKLEKVGFRDVKFLGYCTDDDPENNHRPLFTALAKLAQS